MKRRQTRRMKRVNYCELTQPSQVVLEKQDEKKRTDSNRNPSHCNRSPDIFEDYDDEILTEENRQPNQSMILPTQWQDNGTPSDNSTNRDGENEEEDSIVPIAAATSSEHDKQQQQQQQQQQQNETQPLHIDSTKSRSDSVGSKNNASNHIHNVSRQSSYVSTHSQSDRRSGEFESRSRSNSGSPQQTNRSRSHSRSNHNSVDGDDEQLFCLQWAKHRDTFISELDTFRENGTLVDCTLAAEGKFLKAHKLVLCACSPYFESLLSQQQYDKHPILILKDVKFQELQAIVDYMYRGKVHVSQKQLAALLKTAESLQIKGLSDNRIESSAMDGDSAQQQQQQQQQQKQQQQQQKQKQQVPVSGGAAGSAAKTGLTIEQNNKRPNAELPGDRKDSTSPLTRKRKRVRRRSVDTNNAATTIDNHDQMSNSSSQSATQQAQPITSSLLTLPQITTATSAVPIATVTPPEYSSLEGGAQPISGPSINPHDKQQQSPMNQVNSPLPVSIKKENPTGVIWHRTDCYTIPPLDKLADYLTDDGKCVVPNFTIGRKGYGTVYFDQPINVAGLNLDVLVRFTHQKVVIYPDDENKPQVGEELNRKARITMERVRPKKNQLNYEAKLLKFCVKEGATFVEYHPEAGILIFDVDHFSGYGIDDSDDDDDEPIEISDEETVNQSPMKSLDEKEASTKPVRQCCKKPKKYNFDSDTDSDSAPKDPFETDEDSDFNVEGSENSSSDKGSEMENDSDFDSNVQQSYDMEIDMNGSEEVESQMNDDSCAGGPGPSVDTQMGNQIVSDESEMVPNVFKTPTLHIHNIALDNWLNFNQISPSLANIDLMTTTYFNGESNADIFERGRVIAAELGLKPTRKQAADKVYLQKIGDKEYVGQTTNPIKRRIFNHISRKQEFADDFRKGGVIKAHIDNKCKPYDVHYMKLTNISEIVGESARLTETAILKFIKTMNLHHKYVNRKFNEMNKQEMFEKFVKGETRQLAFGFFLYCQLHNVGEYIIAERTISSPFASENQDFRMKCPRCEQRYVGKKSVLRHMTLQHPGEPPTESEMRSLKVKCPVCGSHYGTRRILVEHIRTTHKNLNIATSKEIVEFNIDDIDNDDGKKTLDPKFSLKCPRCEKLYSRKNLIECHAAVEHPDEPLTEREIMDSKVKCPIQTCSTTFTATNSLKTHLRNQHRLNINNSLEMAKYNFDDKIEEYRIRCPRCGKLYSDSTSIYRHMAKVHPDASPLTEKEKMSFKVKCPDCVKTYISTARLIEHLNNTHTKPHIKTPRQLTEYIRQR